MPRQYVAAQFRGKGMAYTYHNDGEPVRVGDEIKVPAGRGEGWSRATVVDLPFDAPKFPTKEILGLLTDADLGSEKEHKPKAPARQAEPEKPADLFGPRP